MVPVLNLSFFWGDFGVFFRIIIFFVPQLLVEEEMKECHASKLSDDSLLHIFTFLNLKECLRCERGEYNIVMIIGESSWDVK